MGEDARLQHLGRAEGSLLDIGEVILGIAVQLDGADFDEREVLVWLCAITTADPALVRWRWPCCVLKWNFTQTCPPSSFQKLQM